LIKRLQANLPHQPVIFNSVGNNNAKPLDSQSPDLNTFDLNTLSPEDVAVYKKQMDNVFRANQVLPGDSNYQYDIQVFFFCLRYFNVYFSG
jgi:hypothetical protein